MSVYTVVSAEQLERFLERYDLGALEAHEAVSEGIENTNYFVTTTAGEFVLTLFERTPEASLPFFLDLMAHLADRGVVSAHPLAARNGGYLQRLNERPAALVRRLRGSSVARPDVLHCRAIGGALGGLHRAAASFDGHRENDRGARWRAATAGRLAGRLPDEDVALLCEALSDAALPPVDALPAGVIHADLFRDNALFDGHALTGIVDFYFACDGPLLYDLAVTVADWCFDADGTLDAPGARAILEAYHAARPLAGAERSAWAGQLRAAGLRFWLSRLADAHFPREGVLTHTKDPAHFRQVLVAARDETAMDALWPED